MHFFYKQIDNCGKNETFLLLVLACKTGFAGASSANRENFEFLASCLLILGCTVRKFTCPERQSEFRGRKTGNRVVSPGQSEYSQKNGCIEGCDAWPGHGSSVSLRSTEVVARSSIAADSERLFAIDCQGDAQPKSSRLGSFVTSGHSRRGLCHAAIN